MYNYKMYFIFFINLYCLYVKSTGPVSIYLTRENINLILFSPLIMTTLSYFLSQLDCLSIFYDYLKLELFFLSHAHNF